MTSRQNGRLYGRKASKYENGINSKKQFHAIYTIYCCCSSYKVLTAFNSNDYYRSLFACNMDAYVVNKQNRKISASTDACILHNNVCYLDQLNIGRNIWDLLKPIQFENEEIIIEKENESAC